MHLRDMLSRRSNFGKVIELNATIDISYLYLARLYLSLIPLQRWGIYTRMYARVIIVREYPRTIRNTIREYQWRAKTRRMMEHSLKLSKKIKPEWRAHAKFFVEGHRRRPCGRRAHLPHPPPLVKGDSCRRKNPRAAIGSCDRMRATEKHPYRSVVRSMLSSTLSSPVSLARTPFIRPRSLSRARNCARKNPDDYDVDHTAPPLPAAFAVVRSTDRPTALRFPCLNP